MSFRFGRIFRLGRNGPDPHRPGLHVITHEAVATAEVLGPTG